MVVRRLDRVRLHDRSLVRGPPHSGLDRRDAHRHLVRQQLGGGPARSRGRRRLAHQIQPWLALFVALAVGGASLLSVLAKNIVGRDRPPVEIRLQHHTDSAFPSGHSTQAAATYFALAIVVTVLSNSRRCAPCLVRGPFIVFPVGVSRVYLGVHWATDVLGGWLLGSVWVAGLTVSLAPLETRREASVPGSPRG